jgi:hypothetical protein
MMASYDDAGGKVLALIALLIAVGCAEPTTDQKIAAAQAQALEQAHAQVGMPAIVGYQEKHMAKDIYELRDKAIATHTYLVNEMTGCLVYLGPSIGYGLPYAAQYTAPTRDVSYSGGRYQVPQAEPNGLFMPAAAEGTWVLMKDPGSDATKPVYIEPRVIVSPFRLPASECPATPPAPPAKGKP